MLKNFEKMQNLFDESEVNSFHQHVGMYHATWLPFLI